jgi:O-antigen/teichoic acid export membrane protein
LKLKLLCWCGLNQVLLSFILFLRSNIQGLLLFKQDSILSVFDRVLAIVIMCLILWSGWFPKEKFNVIWYLQAQTLAYIVTLVFALTIVLRHAEHLSFKLNFQFFREILRQSLPFAVLVLLMSVYSRIEPVLLERLLDDNGVQAGIYSRAYRLFDAGNNISNLFAIMLLPMFAATLTKKLELNNLVKTSFNVIVAMAGIVMIMCVLYRQEIMQMMYNPEEAEAEAAYLMRIGQYAKVFPLLMGSFFCLSTTYVFGTLLTANGSLRQLNLVAAAGVVINILLNLIVIPRFYSVGAACTSLCVQAVTAFMQYLLAKRILNIDLGGRYWLHIVLFLATITLVTFLVKQMNINWMLGFIISFAINCGAIFFTRLLSLKEIVNLVLPKEKKA